MSGNLQAGMLLSWYHPEVKRRVPKVDEELPEDVEPQPQRRVVGTSQRVLTRSSQSAVIGRPQTETVDLILEFTAIAEYKITGNDTPIWTPRTLPSVSNSDDCPVWSRRYWITLT